MSDLPVFKHDGPVSTVYERGVPRLEQDGELFTFAEYDHKAGKWAGQPQWIPKGKRELAELQTTVDKLIAQLKAVEAALTATKTLFSHHFSAVGIEPPPAQVPRVIGDGIDPIYLNTNLYRPAPVETPPIYPNEQKETKPAVKRRKRAPNKKKIPPAT